MIENRIMLFNSEFIIQDTSKNGPSSTQESFDTFDTTFSAAQNVPKETESPAIFEILVEIHSYP